jgi:hypothetical protein
MKQLHINEKEIKIALEIYYGDLNDTNFQAELHYDEDTKGFYAVLEEETIPQF